MTMSTKQIICNQEHCLCKCYEDQEHKCKTCYFNQAIDISKVISVIVAGEPVNIKAEEDDNDKN